MSNDFNDSTWLTGIAPLGFGSTAAKTIINNGSVAGSEPQRAFYFRKTIDMADGDCYAKMFINLLNKDGSVVYVNGVEVFRNYILPGPVNSTVYAFASSISWIPQQTFTGSWLKQGKNVLAVELHRKYLSTSVYFDMKVSGQRELLTCGPDPSQVGIPWANILTS